MASAPMRKQKANARPAPTLRRRAAGAREADSGHLRLVVKTETGVRLLSLDQIDCLEADGNLVRVYSADGSVHSIRATLSQLLDTLRGQGFLRVHRSAAVRATSIVAVEKHRYRKAFALLQNGMRLEIGRADFHKLRALWHPGVLDLDALTGGLHLVRDDG